MIENKNNEEIDQIKKDIFKKIEKMNIEKSKKYRIREFMKFYFRPTSDRMNIDKNEMDNYLEKGMLTKKGIDILLEQTNIEYKLEFDKLKNDEKEIVGRLLENRDDNIDKNAPMTCPICKSENVVKTGNYDEGGVEYICKNCNELFEVISENALY